MQHSGWKSRKLWFSVFCVLMIAVCAIAAMHVESPTVHLIFEVSVGGIVAVAGLFLTGNVAGKWVGIRGSGATNPPPAAGASASAKLPPEEESSPSE